MTDPFRNIRRLSNQIQIEIIIESLEMRKIDLCNMTEEMIIKMKDLKNMKIKGLKMMIDPYNMIKEEK